MENFTKFKQDVLDSQPLSKQVNLSEIEIVTLNSIRVNNVELNLSKSALSDLVNTLSLKQSVKDKFTKMTQNEQASFLNNVKNTFAKTHNKNINIIVNKDKFVSRIKNNSKTINPNIALKITENLLQKSNKITNSSFNNGAFNISYLENGNEFNAKGTNENFLGGKIIRYNPFEGLKFEEYSFRQVCSNGSFGYRYGEIANLNNEPTKESFFEFMKTIDEHSSEVFNKRLASDIDKLSEYTLSINELATIKKFAVANNLECISEDFYMNEIFERYNENYKELHKDVQKFLNSPFNYWEAINKLTYIGSHTDKFNISDYQGSIINSFAGQLITKEPDKKMFNLDKQLY
jgi:hypothetical protein